MTTHFLGCGCFSDDELGVEWPCCLHRGQTEEQRTADERQQAEEAVAMNTWISDEPSSSQ